jgi:hypothetical protein
MKIKFLMFGEGVPVPKSSLSGGVNFVSLWVDGNGFTCASNDLGALGYILLETQTIDLGDVGEEKQSLFSNLHGQVVDFQVKCSTFVKSGGIATITLTVNKQEDGALRPVPLQFQADDCTGVCFVTNTLSFSATTYQMERVVAEGESVVGDEVVVAVVDSAPPDVVAA